MMTQEKTNPLRGRPRVPLNELHRRWLGNDRKTVETNARRSVHALFDEMTLFEPLGLVSPTRTARFAIQYEQEIKCLREEPFIGHLNLAEMLGGNPSEEEMREMRAEFFEEHGRLGDLTPGPPTSAAALESMQRLVLITICRCAYELAHRHRWKMNGSKGTYTDAPQAQDEAEWSEHDRNLMRQTRAEMDINGPLWIEAKKNGTTIDNWPPPPPTTRGSRRPHYNPDPRPASSPSLNANPVPKQNAVAPAPGANLDPYDPFKPGGLRCWWHGMERTTSPREVMRPILTKLGRLDLLEKYTDEIIQ